MSNEREIANRVFLDLTATPAGSSTPRVQRSGSGVPFWGDSPLDWDVVWLAGAELPGLATCNGGVRQKFQQRKGPGKNGAKYTALGYEPAKVSITLRLWTEDHLRTFEQLARLIRPVRTGDKAPQGTSGYVAGLKTAKGGPVKADPRRDGVALDIDHPNCAIYGVRTVVVMEAGFVELRPGSDLGEVRLTCDEWMGDTRRAGHVAPVNKLDFATLGPGVVGRKAAQLRQQKPSDTQAGLAKR